MKNEKLFKGAIYILTLASLFLLLQNVSTAQNVAVSDDDVYTAHPSAMLDVKSINKGLLVPRLTTVQRTGILSPAPGLMVYDTDLKRFFFFTGSGWQDVSDQGLWALKGKDIILADTTYNVSIGSKKTAGKLTVKGDKNIGVNEPLFSVVNTSGDTIFAVYSEGVRIYVNDEPGKASGNKGGFAVGGFTPSKGVTNEFFRVTADSIRVYVDTTRSSKASGNKGGFAVGGFSPSKGIIPYKYLSVSDDSVRIYIEEPKTKASGNKGGFAVGGFTPAKGISHEFLKVTTDSTRIFVKDSTAGFGIASIEGGNAESFLDLTTQNYFIGHESGQQLTSGKYNSTVGYKSGYSISQGESNSFFGYQSGYRTNTGKGNIFIGYESGYTNKTGNYNTFMGYRSGYNNSGGLNNSFVGSFSGYSNTTGNYNTFMGDSSGYNNTVGYENSFFGDKTGFKNTSGHNNIFIGNLSGFSNTTGQCNVFQGCMAGYSNLSGIFNVFIGHRTGYTNTTGGSNVFLGYFAGNLNQNGNRNVFIGNTTGRNNTSGYNNTIIGSDAGLKNTQGYSNVFIGGYAGHENTTGYNNVFIGYAAGYNETGSNRLYIHNSNTAPPLIYGEFDNNKVTINDVLKLTPRASAPASPTNGEIYINSTNNHIYCYLNGVWKQLD